LDAGQTSYGLRSGAGSLAPDPAGAVAAGASWTGWIGPVRLGVGLLQRFPSSGVAQWRVAAPLEPTLLLHESWYRRSETHVAVAMGDGALRVGVGVALLPSVAADAGALLEGSGADLRISDASLDLHVGPEIAPTLGLQWDQGSFCLGLAWRSRRGALLTRRYSLGETSPAAAGGEAKPLLSQTLRVTAHGDPWTLAGGVALRPLPSLLLLGHLEWARWSELPSPSATGTAATGEGLEPPSPDVAPPPDPHFGDTLSVRAGAELDLPRLAGASPEVRVGYRWDPSPVPEQVGLDTFLDAPLHTASAGLGVRWEEAPWVGVPVLVDLGVQWAWLQRTRVRKTHPTVGTFNTELSGWVLDLGATVATTF